MKTHCAKETLETSKQWYDIKSYERKTTGNFKFYKLMSISFTSKVKINTIFRQAKVARIFLEWTYSTRNEEVKIGITFQADLGNIKIQLP